MKVPGGHETVKVAAREALEYVRDVRRSGGRRTPPAFEAMSIAASSELRASIEQAVNVACVAVISDLILWARSNGDLTGAFEATVRKYATEELDCEIPIDFHEGDE